MSAARGDEIDWSAHPCGDDGSVLVRLRVSAMMSLVEQYDDTLGDATTNLAVVYEWEDPRLVGFPEKMPLPDDLWQPEFHVYGQTQNVEHGYGGEAGSLSLKDSAKGTVTWMKIMRGVVYNCKQTHDIRDFPFDTHIVPITFSCGKTVAGATDRVRLSVDRDMLTFSAPGRGGRGGRIERQAEWETTALAYGICQHSSTVKSYHNAYVVLKRRRVPSWYIHKGLGPTIMCAALSLTALVIPCESIGDRLATLLTLLLTVFAVQWVTQDRLPRTPDLTYMDRVVNVSVYLILLSSMVSAGFMLALRLDYDPETVELAELIYGCSCSFFVGSGVLKVWLDSRRFANSRLERGAGWFADSGVLHSFFKRIEGGGYVCAVIDGDVQQDDAVSIPGDVDIDGKQLGANPLAADSTGGSRNSD